ncbi:MAG TPA: Gfo/Idh/MocA family oxidoreductase, partial [Clostridia bacterium]|nr:Gfo/Idh/MocA family oxidoreductase [Clostridia bacterium]
EERERSIALGREMLEKEGTLDGVMIGTNCDTHARFAELVVDRGLPLFLEKPVFTTAEDSLHIRRLMERRPEAPVVVSFPQRMTHLAQAAKAIIDRGELGEISQIQAVNNVPYARGYFKKWFRAEHITGGLFLQKATHDLDTLRYLTGYTPVMVAAMNTHRILKGDMPRGQTCPDCERYHTCPESTWVLTHRFH